MIEGELPKEWREEYLNKICSPKQWKTISINELTTDGYIVYGANGRIGYYSTYTHEKSTIMITCRGASCGNLHISVPFSYINGNAMALDDLPDDLIKLKYLYYALRARGLNDVISGSAQPQITGQGLSEVKVCIIPLAEQQQIAAKLDELLAQVDSLKTRLDAIPRILKRFRQSVLAAAVSGKLTEENDDWLNYLLKDVCSFENGFAFKSEWFLKDGYAQVVKIGNVKDGSLNLAASESFVSKEIFDIYSKGKIKKNNILISMTGTKYKKDYGFAALVTADQDILVNQRVGKVIPDVDRVVPKFLYLFLRSEVFRKQMFLGETGGVNQGNVGSTHILSCNISIPEISKQNYIVQRVEQFLDYADQIEQRVKDAQSRVNHLTQSILAKAFRGELTAEWREQNPDLIGGENSAEALLARIQAEREKGGKVVKTRSKKVSA